MSHHSIISLPSIISEEIERIRKNKKTRKLSSQFATDKTTLHKMRTMRTFSLQINEDIKKFIKYLHK